MKRFLACLLLSVLVAPVASVSPVFAQARPGAPGSRQPVRLTSPRIAPLPESEWTEQHRAIVQEFAPDGRVGNALSTLLHVPELAGPIMSFGRFLQQESALEPRHRSLLLLRTAWLTHNQYQWSVFASNGRAAGLTDAELRRIAVGPDADGWDAFDAAHLRLADELYQNSAVTDQTWTALGVRYNLVEMVEAVANVTESTVRSMMFNAMGVQPDDWTTDRLPTDVPYRVSAPDRESPLRNPRIAPLEGNGLRVTRTFNRHASLSQVQGGLYGYVLGASPLTDHDRELLILRIGWNCQAEYEWAKHVGSVGRARDHGLEPRLIAQGPGADGWSPFSATLLTLADELYRDATVSDETWAAITADFDTRETMSALMTVGTYRLVSMSLNAFGVQILETDEGLPDIP
jgi:4-carboxymuconolactone decarboxylase